MCEGSVDTSVFATYSNLSIHEESSASTEKSVDTYVGHPGHGCLSGIE